MKKSQAVIVTTSVLLIVAISVGVYLLQRNAAEHDAKQAAEQAKQTQTASKQGGSSVSDLQITDEAVGTGAEAVAGKTISVHYVGTLTDGTKFDSSRDRNQPFDFTLGAGQVIQGWDQGFNGMKVGGKRKLVIPPEMGYGASGSGKIPPNSTLVFEVELLGVK